MSRGDIAMRSQEAARIPTLIALSALAVLPTNMFVPSLPSIARDLDAGFALTNIAVAGYAVASAVTHLIAGSLSDRFGRKPVAVAANLSTVFGAGIIAFASGLIVTTANATVAMTGTMLATSLLSFAAAMLVARAERQGTRPVT